MNSLGCLDSYPKTKTILDPLFCICGNENERERKKRRLLGRGKMGLKMVLVLSSSWPLEALFLPPSSWPLEALFLPPSSWPLEALFLPFLLAPCGGGTTAEDASDGMV